LRELQELLRIQQENFNRAVLGKNLSVLFENKVARTQQLYGRTAFMQAVHVAAPERLIGEDIEVRIETTGLKSLTGTPLMAEAA
jgi:tRNA-2-methylthio-N6-dimethylallyladenosine synthase